MKILQHIGRILRDCDRAAREDRKIRTFRTRDAAVKSIGAETNIFQAKPIFMPADINADKDGVAWAIADHQHHYLTMCGTLSSAVA